MYPNRIIVYRQPGNVTLVGVKRIPGEMIIIPMTEEDAEETDVRIDVVLSRLMNRGATATGETNLQVV